ncbi:C40 family peptidase, partial [Streptomyces sp. JJ66]|uniref:C40 family peptidase n=1 Tax=Streptomyces sp. JJ66 TaxID=2803843 RepID=UPI00214ABAC5
APAVSGAPSAPAAPASPAAPAPPPEARSSAAPPGPADDAAPDGPRRRPVSELLTELRGVYRAVSSATEQYNAADEALREQRAHVRRLHSRLATARTELSQERATAGRLAREQYRGGGSGLPPYLRLLLSRDPQEAFSRSHLLNQAAQEQARTVQRVAGGARRLDRTAEQAEEALRRREELARTRAERRDTVRERLDAVAELLASLSDAQLAAVRELEREQAREAQRTLLSDVRLTGADAAARTPSAAGAQAVRFAAAQLGKPYQWGAEGPDAFDCSGLTSQAWGEAGTGVPRTSQEQWRRLPRVELDDLRPGDLVVYFKDATHVALYVGEGRVVHAPRPGERIVVAPLAGPGPVAGAVRPDPAARPLPRYTPPALPPAG